MKPNLESLRSEIQEHLESRGLAVFYSYPRTDESPAAVLWDTARHPDYRLFVAAAQAAGARLISFFAREFSGELLDEALDRLQESDLPHEDRRSFELRLRELRAYEGRTCEIELSFDLAPRVYIFDLRTDWFNDLNDLLDTLDESYAGEDVDEEEGPLGGYYSKN